MQDAQIFSGLMLALYFGGTLAALAIEYIRTGRVAKDVNTIPRSTKRGGLTGGPPLVRGDGYNDRDVSDREPARVAA